MKLVRILPMLLALSWAACGDETPSKGDATSSGDTSVRGDAVAFPPCSAEGDACDLASPAPSGFVCTPDEDGVGVCRVACIPGLVGECPGRECLTAPSGSFCVARNCSGFFSEDCGPGARCLRDGEASECGPIGTGVRGATCQGHGDCGVGLLCFGGLCASPICTLDGQVPCNEAGARCVAPNVAGVPTDVGFECQMTCTPYTADNPCGNGAWCRPETATSGVCVDVPTGAAPLGGACRVDNDCGARLGCMKGRCQLLCASDSAPGNAWCTTELPRCRGRDGTRSYCLQTCVWPTGTCALANQGCSPGELHGTTFDLCMFAPGDWDRQWPLGINGECEADEEGLLCGPGGACDSGPLFSSGRSVLCAPVCRERFGPLDVIRQHPDCPANHTCDSTRPEVEGAAPSGWGICRWDGTLPF